MVEFQFVFWFINIGIYLKGSFLESFYFSHSALGIKAAESILDVGLYRMKEGLLTEVKCKTIKIYFVFKEHFGSQEG